MLKTPSEYFAHGHRARQDCFVELTARYESLACDACVRRATEGCVVRDVILDVRGLELPEPLERVLDAISRLHADERLIMLIDREPLPLYRILQRNGFAYEARLGTEALYEILIWHKG